MLIGLLYLHTLSRYFKLAWNLRDHQFVHLSTRFSSLVLITDSMILNENQTAVFLLIFIPRHAIANFHTNIFFASNLYVMAWLRRLMHVFHNTCRCAMPSLCFFAISLLSFNSKNSYCWLWRKQSLCFFHVIGLLVFSSRQHSFSFSIFYCH